MLNDMDLMTLSLSNDVNNLKPLSTDIKEITAVSRDTSENLKEFRSEFNAKCDEILFIVNATNELHEQQWNRRAGRRRTAM